MDNLESLSSQELCRIYQQQIKDALGPELAAKVDPIIAANGDTPILSLVVNRVLKPRGPVTRQELIGHIRQNGYK